jgi:hypothetical protein
MAEISFQRFDCPSLFSGPNSRWKAQLFSTPAVDFQNLRKWMSLFSMSNENGTPKRAAPIRWIAHSFRGFLPHPALRNPGADGIGWNSSLNRFHRQRNDLAALSGKTQDVLRLASSALRRRIVSPRPRRNSQSSAPRCFITILNTPQWNNFQEKFSSHPSSPTLLLS